MGKEKVFKMLELAVEKLINTDLLIYPCGSLSKEVYVKINGLPYVDGLGKPEFIDIRDYRDSLLKLIGKLISFYKEI